MKNCIITPTYAEHFHFVKHYLASFKENVIDKESVELCFIINKSEFPEFEKIILPYKNEFNINVIFFDDILLKNKIYLSPENLLRKYGRFSFQTLKKLYGMLEFDADRFLVLDSESLWISKTSMSMLFENHFDNKSCLYSEIDERRFSKFCKHIQSNIDLLLDIKSSKWFIEDFMWYYDKKILTEMFLEYGSPIELVDKVYQYGNRDTGVFEILLYRNYLSVNKEKYNYKLVNVTQACLSNLTPYTYENYFFELSSRFNNDFGLIEIAMMLLNKNNVIEFSNLFKLLNIDIIRCEWGDRKAQEDFILSVKPKIFAASQAHPFGKETSTDITNKWSKGYYKIVFRDTLKRLLFRFSPAYKLGIINRDLQYHTHRMLDIILSKIDKNKG